MVIQKMIEIKTVNIMINMRTNTSTRITGKGFLNEQKQMQLFYNYILVISRLFYYNNSNIYSYGDINGFGKAYT